MEKKTTSRITRFGEVCFWAGLVIELLLVIIDKSAYINPYEGITFRLTFLLFCIKIATTKYTRKEWLCILGVGIIAMISYFVNDRDEIVRVVAFIASCKDMDLKKVMKTVLCVTLAGCVAIILLSVTGIYGVTSVHADYGRGATGEQLFETRYTLGMGHPNALHCMIWMLIALATYCYADKMKWYHYVLFMLVNFAFYSLSNSNTGFLVCSMFIIGAGIMGCVKQFRESKWIYILGTCIVVGCVIFSMVGSHIENTYETPDSLMHKFDKLLNGRYQSCYAVEAARLENWKLFASADNTEFFDAGFVRLFYWYGIIPGILYIAMNLYLLWQSYKCKDYIMFVMVVAFSVYNLMEAHFISFYILRNYLFVLMGYYWYQPFIKEKNKAAYFWQVKIILDNV